ncbi:uncharacterized protein LOC126842143 [Adelges cooleyi]|uniref:uncharacterized protein LOC126842143 n=1 Tax=Adelges cooleyi TaxID=133065 RepID=UPI0021805D70|nr:uncharacterized protein LOC126842143 [Adelges cooleyi]
MHNFKIALTVCVVCFITSAWSVGLNSDQLNRLNNLFENHKTSTGGVSEKQIAGVVKETFGIEWEQILDDFSYVSDEPDSTNLYFLLTTLAQQENKKSDDIEVKWLTPFEVDFFLKEFDTCVESHDQPEYLTLEQLSETFKYWKTIHFALDQKFKKLKTGNGDNSKQDNHIVNAAEFLLIMLEMKPDGRGLTLAQIGKFADLYETHKRAAVGINPFASRKVFEELGITINSELQLLFESAQPAGILLIELILAAAELNKDVGEESPVLSLCEVVTAIREFVGLDLSNDGVLMPKEYANYVEKAKQILIRSTNPTENARRYLMKFDGINNRNVADYMQVVFFIVEHTKHCPYDAKH